MSDIGHRVNAARRRLKELAPLFASVVDLLPYFTAKGDVKNVNEMLLELLNYKSTFQRNQTKPTDESVAEIYSHLTKVPQTCHVFAFTQ
jgi:hypothetical protein